ncbi:P-type conjugative transfer protein TrbG [Asticcacaulis sp.]|uniref:P-type conjugative transfer protein TrbG n=1 Tax=Asticcacaulis sp. TaxID=1872648 RepID=UPI002D082678|nr:P-type conjugative transfer protein TrbG [Asticcacaulis sp.]HTM82250.1 P-type conjugative transfer protein TrbG [Asticcacaulis sp.]
MAIPAAEARPRPDHAPRNAAKAPSASAEVERANASARVQPAPSAFANAEQVYAYAPGSLFQVYTSVGKVTDIALQPGERLVGTGPVAAGDTARWIIGSTESGSGDARQTHILVKPTLPGLSTNLVINSDRRTYHIELQALPATYMASASWRYPQDELIAITQQAEKAKAQTPIARDIDPTHLSFRYRLEGDSVPWRPLRTFDDGQSVYIEMPPATAGTELPPLFLIGDDKKAELVNYRVQSNFLIVDRLFIRAELRLGGKGRQKVVRIVHIDGGRS